MTLVLSLLGQQCASIIHKSKGYFVEIYHLLSKMYFSTASLDSTTHFCRVSSPTPQPNSGCSVSIRTTHFLPCSLMRALPSDKLARFSPAFLDCPAPKASLANILPPYPLQALSSVTVPLPSTSLPSMPLPIVGFTLDWSSRQFLNSKVSECLSYPETLKFWLILQQRKYWFDVRYKSSFAILKVE